MEHRRPDLDGLALAATLHCLTGCAIGEVAGLVLGTTFGWSNAVTIAVAVVLAFLFGLGLTALPLLRSGMPFRQAARIALAADFASITIMEIVDNLVMLIIPGAMDAHVLSLHFWLSMAASLALAGLAAWPVNRWLIGRGRGHAIVPGHHGAHGAGHYGPPGH
jgi:hypothetical protein